MDALSKPVGTARVVLTQYVLLVWFFLVLGLSLMGLFVGTSSQPPLGIGLAVTVPILLFLFGYAVSPTLRDFVRSLNPTTITAIQFYRVLGVAMLILASRNALPALFALPAGWGDIAIGVAAPLVALAWSSGTRSGRIVFIIWNVLGILDLLMAVSLGILTAPSSFGLLAGDITSAAMAVFPMSLIPTFLVPLSLILHLVNLDQLRVR